MEALENVANLQAQAHLERERRVISRSLQKLLVPGPNFALTIQSDPERAEVESFIANKFDQYHNARVTGFMPALLNIRSDDDYSAALGICPAKFGPLFLEQYLDQPAEQAVATVIRAPVSRESIVEIGNLVSTLNGSTALLYLVLVAVLHRAGYQ